MAMLDLSILAALLPHMNGRCPICENTSTEPLYLGRLLSTIVPLESDKRRARLLNDIVRDTTRENPEERSDLSAMIQSWEDVNGSEGGTMQLLTYYPELRTACPHLSRFSCGVLRRSESFAASYGIRTGDLA